MYLKEQILVLKWASFACDAAVLLKYDEDLRCFANPAVHRAILFFYNEG